MQNKLITSIPTSNIGIGTSTGNINNIITTNGTLTINGTYSIPFYSSGFTSNQSIYASSSISYYTPEMNREERKKQLKSELENDPELLNEIIVDLRKDKIKKIRNKNGI
jgi:hypothetical protein